MTLAETLAEFMDLLNRVEHISEPTRALLIGYFDGRREQLGLSPLRTEAIQRRQIEAAGRRAQRLALSCREPQEIMAKVRASFATIEGFDLSGELDWSKE